MNQNKVLNIIAWITFVLSIVSYALDEVVPVEACYLVLVSLFLVLAPRYANGRSN